MPPVLVHLPISAWSHRARQALRVEGIVHRRRVYVPTLSEPALRWQTRRWTGPVSVPVLIPEDGPALTDSTAIAAWASARGRHGLLPPSSEAAVRPYVALAQRALDAGRVCATRRVLDDPGALREALPPPLRALGPVGLPVARQVAHGLLRKYGGDVPEDAAAALSAALEALEAAVDDRPHLVAGRLTWADLAVASALAFVRPPPSLRLPPHTAAAFTDADLTARFDGLLAWRDAVEDEVARLSA